MENNNEVLEVETVTIGDKVYNKDAITPSIYFDYVKGMKNTFDKEEEQLVIDQALKMINKAKITKQVDMAKKLSHQVELALREMSVAREGFDIYVNRKDIERYIEKVESKSVKIIELSRYTREIPDTVMDKVEKASELFDELYVVFTDYSLKETKKVAKERRDKDPVIFGAFIDKDSDSSYSIYVEDRLFFICDWVEDKCDLTLEEIVRDVKDKDKKDIVYRVETSKDEEQIKTYLNSFSEPVGEHIEPDKTFLDKFKTAVTKTVSKRGRKKKE